MVQVRYGGRNGYSLDLEISDTLLAVRTHERRSVVSSSAPEAAAPLTERARAILGNFDLRWSVPRAGVEVLRAAVGDARAVRDEARAVLKLEEAVRFAGRVLRDAADAPVLYTENFFVKFDDEEDRTRCEEILANYKLTIKRRLTYARNAYFAEAAEGTGIEVFDIAQALLNEQEVQLCHPELVREKRERSAFPQQWHLIQSTINGHDINSHVNILDAWQLTQGEGVTIAIVDDGVDIDHEEFRSAGKIVAPRDVTLGVNDPRPGNLDKHGTPCAGVACADGKFGASGVAPRARLMPIRLASDLGSQEEAEAFEWAARNGADVISCSWGPTDGDFRNPNDPRHNRVVPLPDSTRTAIDFATTTGRNGKGCVVLFAAGNGNESVDNDGYASYERVIAVAACDDTGAKSAYSDFGNAVWCTFPSSSGRTNARTRGIWTTDVSGKPGRNAGGPNAPGDEAGHYTNNFGGTSSACPGVAGVAALVISRNPDLRWDQVKDIFRRTSDPIDVTNGTYDTQGHSPMYGFGRVNARRAVEAAVPEIRTSRVVRRIQPNVVIPDMASVNAVLDVPDTLPIAAIRATVDIEHTFIGDLTLRLQPPGGQPILLHARQGGGTDNIKKTYDIVSTPALQNIVGQSPAGAWTLSVVDEEAQDTGVLRAFELELNF